MMTDMTSPQPLRPPLADPQAMSPAAPSAPPQLAPVGAVGADMGSGNPILDEVHQKADAMHASLTPPAKEAVAQSGILGNLTPPEPAASPLVPPGSGSKVSFPFLGQGGRAMSPAETQLQHTQSTGSGLSRLPMAARIPLGILEGIGSALPIARNILPFIPGTEAHHRQVEGQQQEQVNTESAEQKAADAASLSGAQTAEAQAKVPLTEAQTQNQEAMPELKRTAAELAAEKQGEVERHNRETAENARTIAQGKTESAESIAKEKHRANLAQHGLKEDETGKIVSQPYEEMSEPLQAIHDLKAAQSEAQEAAAALKKAQAENQPAMAALAQKRLQSAGEAHSIALRRLNLSEAQFEMRSRGTSGGEALPGAMLNDENKPVGTAFQQNVRPTGQERNKADLANSAHEQLQDIKGIVAKRPDIFGPLAGRTTDFKVWLGSQDPDAQRFRAARTIAGDHLAGVFGGRSEAALTALDAAIGHFKDNPAALQAGLDQLDKANRSFQKAGSVKTQGSDAGKAATGSPKAGDVEGTGDNRYKFKGGDPKDQKNWEKQ